MAARGPYKTTCPTCATRILKLNQHRCPVCGDKVCATCEATHAANHEKETNAPNNPSDG